MSKTNTIAYIKLISGEYVLGKVEHEDENIIILKKPLGVKFEMMVGGLQMFPYDAFYLNREPEEVIFKKDQILHEYKDEEVPEELQKKYTEFESGIVQQQTPDLGAGMSGMGMPGAGQDIQKLLGM